MAEENKDKRIKKKPHKKLMFLNGFSKNKKRRVKTLRLGQL